MLSTGININTFLHTFIYVVQVDLHSDWDVTSPTAHLQVKRPNQQYQSTEGTHTVHQ